MIKGTKNGYPDLLSRGMIIRCISENHLVITRQPNNRRQIIRAEHTIYIIEAQTYMKGRIVAGNPKE